MAIRGRSGLVALAAGVTALLADSGASGVPATATTTVDASATVASFVSVTTVQGLTCAVDTTNTCAPASQKGQVTVTANVNWTLEAHDNVTKTLINQVQVNKGVDNFNVSFTPSANAGTSAGATVELTPTTAAAAGKPAGGYAGTIEVVVTEGP